MLLLLLSRLMILNYCLKVPNCCQTFSSTRCDIAPSLPPYVQGYVHAPFQQAVRFDERKGTTRICPGIHCQEFESSRDNLAAHDNPNFSSDSRLQLVIDEAQILSDKNPTLFAPSSIQGDPRPIEFPGWVDVNSVQAYVDRLKEQLPDNESKTQVNTLIPSAAADTLHKQLAGRFRHIEGILENGKWDTAIERTETVITPWKNRQHGENLCGELNRLETKIADNLKPFTSWPSIMELLEFYLFHHHLLDTTLTAFGHIELLGGISRTVLNELLTLKATINYFQEKDPSYVLTAKRVMLHLDNP
ncbi:hypothetical protein EC991_006263 [Linnemannia zychae]|nr:hypothetical protein EC991_006263 [Linnemannia zychae]